MYCQHHDIGNLIHLPSPVFIGASLSEPHHHVTMLMAFLYVCTCMYVCTCITCTVVIPYCVLIQNYMKTFSKCKLALIVTPSNATLTVSSSSCSTTWILVVRVLLRRKDKVSLMTKRNTESVEIEK